MPGFVPIRCTTVTMVVFTSGSPDLSCGFWRLFLYIWYCLRLSDVKTTTATVVHRDWTNPGTRSCILVYSNCFEELSRGRNSKNDFADIWHIVKIWKNHINMAWLDLVWMHMHWNFIVKMLKIIYNWNFRNLRKKLSKFRVPNVVIRPLFVALVALEVTVFWSKKVQ